MKKAAMKKAALLTATWHEMFCWDVFFAHN
jgi:hypothetical protein